MSVMSILLKDGSLNKLVTLGTVASGAVIYDMEVRIFVIDDAVWAFRKDRYKKLKTNTTIDGYGEAVLEGIDEGTVQRWYEQLAELKEIGDVSIHLCSLCCDLDNLEKDDFIDIVDHISSIGRYINEMILDADKVVTI
jgi:peroxiredoxin family protein